MMDCLPLWPLFYYRREQGDHPERVGRGLAPFLLNLMRYTPTDGSAGAWCLSVLVFVLRLLSVPSEGKWSFDLLWPIFRVGRSGKSGTGEGRVFSLRLLPLLFIYVSERRILIILAPCVVFYKSFQGSSHDWRTVLHIFPVISLVSYHQTQQHKFFLSLFYLFYYRTIQRPSAWDANTVFKYRAIVLFPIFWHFKEGHDNINTICGIVWLYLNQTNFTFVIFPFLWLIKGSHSTIVYFLIFYLNWENGLRKLALFPIFTYDPNSNRTSVAISVLLLFWLRIDTINQQRRVITVMLIPLFLFYRSTARNHTVVSLFYIVWITKDTVANTSSVAVLPFFYHRSPTWKRIVGFLIVWTAQNFQGLWWFTVFPFFMIRREGGSLVSWLFPLFYFHRRQGKLTVGVLFLFWWYSRGTEERRIILFPFFWWFSTNTESFVALIPFGFLRRSQTSVYALGFPFWFSRTSSRWSFGLLPFFTIGRSTNSITLSFMLVIWIHWANDFFLLTLFGLFWLAKASNSFYLYLIPFVWIVIEGTSKFCFLFPLLLVWLGSNFKHISAFPLFHFSRTENDNRFYSLGYLLWWWKYNNKWSLCCIDCFWRN